MRIPCHSPLRRLAPARAAGANRRLAFAAAPLFATAVFFVASALPGAVPSARAQEAYYHKPMPEVEKVLEARPIPAVWLSPARDVLLIADRPGYPPLADLAAPKVKLAGVRVNPVTNGPHRQSYFLGLTVKSLGDAPQPADAKARRGDHRSSRDDGRRSGGATGGQGSDRRGGGATGGQGGDRRGGGASTGRRVTLPVSIRISSPLWSADGKWVAFTNTTKDSLELWVLDVAQAAARRIPRVHLNGALGWTYLWMPDQRTLLVKMVDPDRGPPPRLPPVPTGPDVQEGSGKHGIGSTYERRDVLETAHDEDLFDYYGTSALAFVDVTSGTVTRFGKADLFGSIQPSPDGEHFIVERIHRPYSHLHPWWRFPREVEIWDGHAQVERRLASLPLADQVPSEGVPTGPRFYSWRPTAPATLFYVEALDQGDPDVKVPHRDRLLTWAAPFSGEASEVMRLKERFAGIAWTDSSGIALVDEYDRERRWETTYQADLSAPGAATRVIWDLSENEKYKAPGAPLLRPLANGFSVIDRDGASIYLAGAGATPSGDRPFLDRFDLETLRTERLFRCDPDVYEFFMGWAGTGRSRFLTRRESPKEPPNTFLRILGAPISGEASEAATAGEVTKAGASTKGSGEAVWTSTLAPITQFPDPTPELRGITKRIVTYKRPDGTPLSFTLYLPPGYKSGRLPTVLWAYPLEYSDEGTAGQVSGSDRRFTQITGASPLFFTLDGYAVLDNVAMPVIGHPDSVYNVYLGQLVANAKAAIDKAVELGVTDRDRVGIAGHSHGAFMTANLLAHSDLFRAGIARSGAYNHTLRPFGFQSERRTYFQAPESYIRLSPELHADKINEPILIIHGEDDANPGTVPLQSDLLYRAVVGTGGTARLVMLPLESHSYEAKESIEETLWEMMTWFARYVKEAPDRASVK